MRPITLAVLLIVAPAFVFAQKWEFGVDGGAGFLNNVSVTGAGGSATAGFARGFVAGGFLSQNLYTHVSGEIRYEYMESDLRLMSAGQTARFSGAAHAVHYDVVFHTAGHSPVQFFGEVGGGVKDFVGTGLEAAYQPLSQYGYFTKTQAVRPLLTGSAGFTAKLGTKLRFRAELRDYTTTFPTKVLTPPTGVKYGNLLNEIVPIVSIVFIK
jgi:hypothetical protein